MFISSTHKANKLLCLLAFLLSLISTEEKNRIWRRISLWMGVFDIFFCSFWEMGNCISIHRTPGSASKLKLSSSPYKESVLVQTSSEENPASNQHHVAELCLKQQSKSSPMPQTTSFRELCIFLTFGISLFIYAYIGDHECMIRVSIENILWVTVKLRLIYRIVILFMIHVMHHMYCFKISWS